MQFNSYIFILGYLPILVFGYFVLNKVSITAGKLYLIAGSTVFYLYGGYDMALVFVLNIIFNFIISKMLCKRKKRRKVLLVLAIVTNIGMLLYYKYYNFFITNINIAFQTEFHNRDMVLPLGISFFTFQQIAYVIDLYRDELHDVSDIDYLAYILYFPKLIMGPIVEPAILITNLNEIESKRVNWDHIAAGIKIFCFGLFKKVLLADTFANAVSWGYSNINLATSMDWFLVMLFYTFQIYFDFSGYCDMAVGVSTMLNIRLPMNFDSPYKGLSIRDFWKRWHITLTSFFTKYIYIPLGGSRKGKIRTYLNTLIVFLISGIWHGANWTFVLWGFLHGLLSIFDRCFEKTQEKISETVRWMGTFWAVNILWLLFRSDTVQQWYQILCTMFTFEDMSVSSGLISCFILPETDFLNKLLHLEGWNASVKGLWMLIFMIVSSVLCLVPENNYKSITKNNVFYMFLAAIAFVWSFLCLSSESVFVYFNF